MAEATSFDESNGLMNTPKGMTSEEVAPLSVLRTIAGNGMPPQVISCWKLTKEELEEVNRTGRIWLGVMGVSMPPVYITGIKPFARVESADEST